MGDEYPRLTVIDDGADTRQAFANPDRYQDRTEVDDCKTGKDEFLAIAKQERNPIAARYPQRLKTIGELRGKRKQFPPKQSARAGDQRFGIGSPGSSSAQHRAKRCRPLGIAAYYPVAKVAFTADRSVHRTVLGRAERLYGAGTAEISDALPLLRQVADTARQARNCWETVLQESA